MADVSHWFVKRRGLAVVLVASGNYLAGAVWPLFINAVTPSLGWRGVHLQPADESRDGQEGSQGRRGVRACLQARRLRPGDR